MNIQTQASKSNDENAAEHDKALQQNQNAALNENAPAFTKIEPAMSAKSPQLQAAKGNDEVMSQPPQPAVSPTTPPTVNKPIPMETAQEAVHEVMPKTEAKKIGAEVAATSVEKAPAKDEAKKVAA